MSLIKFVKGSDVLQFTKGTRFPLSKIIALKQATDRTAGGGLEVEDLGIKIHSIRLLFTYLLQEDYDGLVDWYENIAVGALNTFTYHDEDGQTMAVRLLTPELDFPEVRHQRFNGELLLEVVG